MIRMIARKYWVPAALVAIFIASAVASNFVTADMICGSGDDSTECQYHHFCMCGKNIWGILVMLPVLSLLGLAAWLMVSLSLWLFGKFQKMKRKTKS